MYKLLTFAIILGVSHGFFLFGDPAFPMSQPIFNKRFWKDFETSMKDLGTSIKTSSSAEDTETADTELTEMMETPQDPFSMFFGMPSRPWWMGKNVCVTKEETDLGSESDSESNATSTSIFSGMRTRTETCAGGNGRYTCTAEVMGGGKHVRTTVKYECCHGFKLQANRCVQVMLANMTSTLREVAPEFARMMETTGVMERIEKEDENFTVFTAFDETLDDLRDNLEAMNQLELNPARRRREAEARTSSGEMAPELTKVMLNHVVKGKYHSSDMVNNKVVESLSGYNLRTNVYQGMAGPIVTINCKRLVKADKMADNGLVHVLDGVLKPVQKNVADIIREDERLSMFRSLLEKDESLMERITKDDVTVFAPTDDALLAHPELMTSSCSNAIMAHHITPHVLCTSGLTDGWSVSTFSGERVRLSRSNDAIMVDDQAKITLVDVVGTNGVVHVIDALLMPDAGKPLSDILTSRNLTTMQALLKEAGLDKSEANLTWFAPREDVFADPETKAILESVRGDPEKLREVLLFHSTQPMITLPTINNEEIISTRADKPLRFNMYSPGPMFSFTQPRATVNCARVRLTDSRACGANVHEVDRLLLPPTGDLMQRIADSSEFSILRKIIEKFGLEEELRGSGPMTLLAPTDDAFNDLSVKNLNAILANETLARGLVRRHILPESICCHGVSGHQWLWPHHVAAKDGSRLQARRDAMDHIHFGRTRVSQCDQMATNGILHTVNRVLVPREDVHNPFSTLALAGSSGWAGANPNVEIFLSGL